MANSKKRGITAWIPENAEPMEAVRVEPDAFIVEPLAPWEDKIAPRMNPVRQKISRKVEWRSADGTKVVVAGPFPTGLYRSETRKSVEAAAKLTKMWKRDETTREDFAKVRAEDVNETGGENEFGTITP